MASALANRSSEEGLKEALREARLAEAAHFEAALDLRDAKSIRLQLLKDDLIPIVQSNATAAEIFDLALVPGEPPKLWIDLISFVTMEPDHRTYRLVQDRHDGREILQETSDRKDMSAFIRRHMAHRLVARERRTAQATAVSFVTGYSTGSLILAWISGFALGALILLSLAIYLEILGN